MLNLVPLAGPRWIMTNGYIQSRLIGPPLQLHFPEPKAIAIAAPAVGTNQDPLRLGIEWAPHLSPPTANALHGKTGCVMRTTHGHPPQVVLLIVDPTRHGLGNVRIGEIMDIDRHRLSFRLPFLPGICVVSDQFFLLGIDRYDGPTSAQERLALALDVAKLSIPIGVLFPFFGLGIPLQTVV